MGTGATGSAGGEASGSTSDDPVRPPFPFLVGSGRSGTTLMRAMLDSHPEVAVPPETYFVTELVPRVAGYQRGGDFATDVFLDDVLANQFFTRWGLSSEAVREALLTDPPTDYPDAIRRLYGLFAASHGKRRYADKTPVYVYDIETLARLFPEARFVHLIRDGRDVACSFLDQEDMRPNGVGEAALLWRERVAAGRSAGAALGASRYIEIRYEDLIGDTVAVLRRLCGFVGVKYDPAMLTYTERAGDLVALDGGPQRHRGVFLKPQAGLRDWRTELSGDSVEVFELIAGDLLADLGYERHADTRWAKEHAAVHLLVDEVERLRGEVVTGERTLRQRIRILRGRLRQAKGRPERQEVVGVGRRRRRSRGRGR